MYYIKLPEGIYANGSWFIAETLNVLSDSISYIDNIQDKWHLTLGIFMFLK